MASRSTMGFDFGLESPETCFKQKNRWIFSIANVAGGESYSKALPPLRSNRPSIELKEQQIAHVIEDVYYPIKADWKPVNLTLYDIKTNTNPVFDWLNSIYDPENGKWKGVVGNSTGIKRRGTLSLFSGCGDQIESWIFENIYPISINWGDLDMGIGDVVTVELNLRYDRAYISKTNGF